MLKDALKPYLDPLKRRDVTNRHVAGLLNVSEAHLSRTLKTLIVKDPIVPNKRKQLTQTRKLIRTKVANDKSLTIAQAAKQANCSPRTIYRYRHAPTPTT